MSLQYALYLVHLGYLLQLFALLARDVLWLRGILVAAQSVLAAYAWLQGPEYLPYVFWNALFVAINLYWVVRLLRERAAVKLPQELRATWERHFAALAPPEFLRLWREGRRGSIRDAQLVREGAMPDALYFLLSGEVAVRRHGRELTRLAAGNFVAEMSLLTGERTTADVHALGAVEYMAWPAATLSRLRTRNPVLWNKVQSVLGHDLVEKIRRAADLQGGGGGSAVSCGGSAAGGASVSAGGSAAPGSSGP
ncbi:MAG: Crp/Fnr family transcriptional regulator [Nevskiaceae bacterium]